MLSVGTMGGLPVEAYLEVAAGAGFEGISLRPADVEAWVAAGPRRTPTTLGRLVRAAGLVVAELDPVMGWHDVDGAAALPELVRRHLGWAGELEARQVTALVPPGARHEAAPAAEGLAALAELAAGHAVGVQVEPFAWSSLHGLQEAAGLAVAAGPVGSVGLMVDTWHLARAGGGLAALSDVPVERVHGVQVADGPAQAADRDLAEENRSGRAWPGEGELRPDLVVAALAGRGWTGPVGVEVFGPAGEAPARRAARAARALDAVLPGGQ